MLEVNFRHECSPTKDVAYSDSVVDGGILQGKLLGVDKVVDAVVFRGGEVVYKSPASVLLWDNTNARAAEVVLLKGPAILFSVTSFLRATLTTCECWSAMRGMCGP